MKSRITALLFAPLYLLILIFVFGIFYSISQGTIAILIAFLPFAMLGTLIAAFTSLVLGTLFLMFADKFGFKSRVFYTIWGAVLGAFPFIVWYICASIVERRITISDGGLLIRYAIIGAFIGFLTFRKVHQKLGPLDKIPSD